MAFGEVVIDGDFVARVQQFLDANRADVTSAAGNKDIHGPKTKRSGAAAQWEFMREWSPQS